MRTTLTIDDDLAGLLKQRAFEIGVPFNEIVNQTIRAGLGLREPDLGVVVHGHGAWLGN